MNQLINVTYVVNALLFSVMGMVIFMAGFWVMDKLTPVSLVKEIIDEHNVALAVVIAGVSIGICQIIASAIHS